MRHAFRSIVVALATLVLGTSVALADVVVPKPEVVTRVVLRASASSSSDDIGSLRPGDQAELLGSVPNWYRVRLNNVEGFVSKRWTTVITTGTGGAATAATAVTIDFVDVGTGLGVLVRGGDFTLVYDAGSNDDLARGTGNRMLAYMRATVPTLSTIDHMVLSHPHRDHVELMPDLFTQYAVRNVWDSGRLNDICGYRFFLTAVRDEAGVTYHSATRDAGAQSSTAFEAKSCYGQAMPAETIQLTHGSRIDQTAVSLGQGVSMTFLHSNGASSGSPNENSLVMRLDIGNRRILFMGDAEAGGRHNPSVAPTAQSIEGVLLSCCSAEVAADVLVVGHHGSMTSSRTAFLNAVGATTYVVSSGPMQYGSVVLPDQVVINALTARGQVFRTDVADASCLQNAAKVGPDADNRAGGCDNIRIVVPASGSVQVTVIHPTDPP